MYDIEELFPDAKPGRDIQFKRREGRGRPCLGRIVTTGPRHLTVALSNGQFETVDPLKIHKVLVKKGKTPKLDPLLVAKAEQFEKQHASIN